MLGSQIFSPAIIILPPRHVVIAHAAEERVEMVDGGRWRTRTEADGSIKMAGSGLASVDFRHKFASWPVGFPDMPPPTSSWPPDMLPSDTRTRSDPKRKLTEDGGSRRKRTEADGSRKMAETALESVDFTRKFGSEPVGFPDILSLHRHHHSVAQTS